MLKSASQINDILDILSDLIPNPQCELNFTNVYELSIAVILSAQTTDKSVNLVTPALFKKYPSIETLSKASIDDVVTCINKIGLAKRKSESIIAFSKIVLEKYHGIIPATLDELITLPGVGSKTANVITSVGYNIPGLAVDTHVMRVSKRLEFVLDNYSPLQIEKRLKQMIEPEKWLHTHHLLIHFGRYYCKAQKPLCDSCPIKRYCTYNLTKKTSLS